MGSLVFSSDSEASPFSVQRRKRSPALHFSKPRATGGTCLGRSCPGILPRAPIPRESLESSLSVHELRETSGHYLGTRLAALGGRRPLCPPLNFQELAATDEKRSCRPIFCFCLATTAWLAAAGCHHQGQLSVAGWWRIVQTPRGRSLCTPDIRSSGSCGKAPYWAPRSGSVAPSY